ncbi:ABC transporter substrate-binding protein [Methylobacterium organophilum]|uniref:ABC transporter substrate-binding protein n=1 Tax=Methylobacterium organophilum TaxID=410 RepID=UPI001F13C685|nr:ABC transporter substrate-binding protein [Methylobacterium organophilum]UMY18330.1 ABC transporter substrate-binding protein [Methylobacterium organophilum]
MLLSSGCGDRADPSPAERAHLRLAYGWYPTCFDYAQSNPFALFGRQLIDTLLSENRETGALEPYLAESWQTLDDGRTYEFILREGVTFSNGEALDAEAVARNFRTLWTLAEQGVSPTPAAYLRGFLRAEALDRRTVRVAFKEPNAGFLQANTEGQFGILAPETLAKTPEERCAQGVIGSGPFVLREAVQDERVEYVRREGYAWAPATYGRQGPAALERVTIRIVPEESLRAAGVLAGEYDLAYSIYKSGVAQAAGQEAVRIVTAPNRGVVNSFVVNTADPVLSDRAVRRAIQHGIDRAPLVSAFYGDGVEAASDVVSRGHPFYADHSDLLRYDPDRARRLLDEAGWKPGADGIRAKDGRRLEVGLTFVKGTIGSLQVGWEYVQNQLSALGIALVLRSVSLAEQADIRTSGRWQLAVLQGASRGDADGIASFYSTALTVWKGQAPRPEVDALLERQSTTVDPQERHRIVELAVRRILDEGDGIPLFDSAQVLLVSKPVQGLSFPLNAWEPILYRVEKAEE